MAKVKDPLHSLEASGTVGGITYQDWRGLGVVREKPTPTQPNTPRQSTVRGIVADLSRVWANELTEGQRIAWKQFADVFVWTDIFGRELRLTGINLFTKINFQLKDFFKPLQITPPPAVQPSEIGVPSIVNGGGNVKVTLPILPAGETASQSPFLDVWIAGQVVSSSQADDPPIRDLTFEGNGMPQGVNPVKSDFRHIVYDLQTEEIGPPPAPLQYVLTFLDPLGELFTTPQRIACIIRRYNKHGRYSTAIKVSLVTTIAP